MKKIIYIFFIVHSMFIGNAFADWAGPDEVVSGKWGSAMGEFGKVSGVVDEFPRSVDIGINCNDEIYINDLINSRIYKFDRNGRILQHNIHAGPMAVHQTGSMMIFAGKEMLFYNGLGGFLGKKTIDYAYYRIVEKGFLFIETKIINDTNYAETFHLYSPKGEYTGAFTKRELTVRVLNKKKKIKRFSMKMVLFTDLLKKRVKSYIIQ